MNAAHSAGSSVQYPPSRYTDLLIKSLLNFSLGNLLGILLELLSSYDSELSWVDIGANQKDSRFPKSKLISYVCSVGCAAKRLFRGFCLHCVNYLILNTCQ